MYKIVYSLIEYSDYIYSNELYFSLRSLRMYNSDILVELLTDKETISHLKELKNIYEYINSNSNINTVDIPNIYSQKQKSRYLKTSLRQLVKGDFLFIDTDTIICDKLPEIISTKPLGVILDRNKKLSELPDDHTKSIYLKCGIDMPSSDYYLNSGVMWVKDVNQNYTLFNSWHNSWKEKANKFMSFMDQPSFNYILNNGLFEYDILDGTMNCQISSNPFPYEYLDNAVIIHYYNNQNKYIDIIKNINNKDDLKNVLKLI